MPGLLVMRVAFVFGRCWPSIGGVEGHLHRLGCDLAAAGHAVQAIAPVNDQGNADPYRIGVFAPRIGAYEADGVTYRGLDPGPLERLLALPTLVYYLPRLRRWFYGPLLSAGVRSYRRTFAPRLARLLEGTDVLHCAALNHLGWAAHDAARRAGCAFVLQPFVHPGQYGDDELNLRLARRADAVIALLEEERRFYLERGVAPEKLAVVGVSPDLEGEPDAAGFRARHRIDGPLVAFVGRQAAYKGLDLLVEAVRTLRVARPGLRLAIAGPRGDGPRLPDEPWLLELGRVDAAEKTALLAAADLLCLPSRNEILPTVVLEAWSLGKPVVAGDIPYLRSLVDHGADGLLAAHTAEAVAGAIGALLDDPALAARMGRAGREKVAARYAPERVLQQTLAVYRLVDPGMMRG